VLGLEKEKAKQLKERRSASKLLTKTSFLVNITLLTIAWAILLMLIRALTFDAELASFDPFKILGVDPRAEDKEIRKAYRKLSLEYHPDKNQGNKLAEEMFMKVAKAYEALTDEEAKKNWLEFGNPDGKQSLEVSIGLPTFLLDESNHYAILCIYLGILVVIIPAIVAAWYQHSRKFGENNVMYETYSFFLHVLSEHSTAKMLPEVLAGAAENRSSGSVADATTRAELMRLTAKLRQGLMHKPRFEHPAVLKGNVLLHAHLHRLELSPELRTDLRGILVNAPTLVDAMMELAQSQRWMQTSVNVVEFSQYLTQALWVRDHSLAQVPHFSDKEIQHCVKGKGAVKSLREYLTVADEQKKGLATMSDLQCADVTRVCKLMPALRCKFKLYVEDEVEIAERDLVTLLVAFDRTNLVDGRTAPPVHAPMFPAARLESWWVLVSDRAGNLILADKINAQSKIVNHHVKFLAPPQAGTYIFNIDLKSSDYLGLDIHEQVKMTVIPASQLPEYSAHPDDLNLDDEPTLFEQVMSGNADTDSETDNDEENDQGTVDTDVQDEAALTEAERRRRKARIQRKKEIKQGTQNRIKEASDDVDINSDEDG
jgi:translocation protein SEC63